MPWTILDNYHKPMEQQWINHSEINMMKFQFKNSDFNPIETWQCALHQYIFKAV